MSETAPDVATLERDGGIAMLVINYPPVNALGQQVREAIADALVTVAEDDSIEALVIRCDGRTYFAGADIREFGKPRTPPFLPQLFDQIEACPKPVITAIHGSALGGGLELAMACHFRLATASAKLGVPEVTLGILPGAGGTQRLPRLIGIDKALDMLAFGKPISAAAALDLGLLDAIISDDIAAQAVAFARMVVAEGRDIRRTRDRREKLADVGETAAAIDRFEAANTRKFRSLDAPLAILKVVRGVLDTDFDKGVALERELFLKLREGPQAAALRHSFFAEREAAKLPGLAAKVEIEPVNTVGIVGAGMMGSAIAINFLKAGLVVRLVARRQESLDQAVSFIHGALDRQAATGRLSVAAADATKALLQPTLVIDALADADLVIESVEEKLAAKLEIFTQISRIAKPDALLATNTSYLDIDDIAAATDRPQQVLGLHFFSPANVMKLVEVVRGAETSDAVLASALALTKRIGKIAVIAGNMTGFIGNRMLRARHHATEMLLLDGASPSDVDRVAETFGMAMGPFRVRDMTGLDIGWTAEQSAGATLRDRLCEAGRRGQKSGAGFYDYGDDGRPGPSAVVDDMIARLSVEQHRTRRTIDDGEILARLHYPVINEGARILQEGVALRASDIDTVWINGFGWPAWTGGPMFHADRVGLPALIDTLRRFEIEPAALLVQLAATGETFAEFDAARR